MSSRRSLFRAIAIAMACTAVAVQGGCSRKCVRHSECNGGESCSDGVCLLVVHRGAADAPGVDAMTPRSLPDASMGPTPRDAAADAPADGG